MIQHNEHLNVRFILLLQSSSSQLYKLECLFRVYEPCLTRACVVHIVFEHWANLPQPNQSDLLAVEAKITKQIIVVLGCFESTAFRVDLIIVRWVKKGVWWKINRKAHHWLVVGERAIVSSMIYCSVFVCTAAQYFYTFFNNISLHQPSIFELGFLYSSHLRWNASSTICTTS